MDKEEFKAAWGEDFPAKVEEWQAAEYSIDIAEDPFDNYISSSVIVTGSVKGNFPAGLEKAKLLFPDLSIEYSAIQLAKTSWLSPQMEQITLTVKGASDRVDLLKQSIVKSLNEFNQSHGVNGPPIQWS